MPTQEDNSTYQPAKWTKALRTKLHGVRRPDPNDPSDVAFGPSEAWARLRADHAARAGAGYSFIASGAHAGPLTRVLAQLADETPPATLDVGDELVRAAVLLSNGPGNSPKWEEWATARALVSFWCHASGPTFAVTVLNHRDAFSAEVGSVKRNGVERAEVELFDNTQAPFALHPSLGNLASVHQPCWWALRCFLSTRSEPEFATASADLQRTFGALAGYPRQALAFALSRDQVWLRKQATAAVALVGESAGPELEGMEMVLSALEDPTLTLELIGKLGNFSGIPMEYAFDVVESQGLAAAQVLEGWRDYWSANGLSKKELSKLGPALKLAGSKA